MKCKKRVFIVVINWNKKDITLECLKSLKRYIGKRKDINVIIVDNASTDGSQDVLKKFYPNFKLIESKRNLGWTGGNNLGIKHAMRQGADCIMLFANDAVLPVNSLDLLVETLFSQEKIGIVGPKIYKYGVKSSIINAGGMFDKKRYFGIEIGHGELDRGQYNKIKEVEFVVGTAITIKREVFETIGFFNKQFFIYYEDADFCSRAKKAGYSCVYEQRSVIYHRGAATTKVGSPLHTYYNTRNHLLFVERHAPYSVRVRENLRMPKTMFEFLFSSDPIRRKYCLLAVRDYYFRRFGQRTYW